MKKTSVIFGGLLVVVIGFFLWWNNGMQAPDLKNTENSIFVINKGTAIRQVGNDLKEQGFIKDPVIFFLYVKKEGIDTGIQAGSYRLSPSMTLQQVMDTLQHGTIDVWVTIPEGFRAEEIAEVLEDTLISYQPEWVDKLKQNEGYLFPDTYLIPTEADIDSVISIMRNNFNTKVESIGLDPQSNLNEIVIIASLIEREAITDNEKFIISSVIDNRLNAGMGLDIDATLQYIKGKSNGSWWTVPTGEERQINSPYNTYRNAGLPPGPISNPGIVAIEAAMNPSKSPYFFYIHDREGNIYFAENLNEHNENVNRYLK
jgi:UPF0755 protein